MWLIVQRSPRPDAPAYPGRVALAVIDALVWPAFWSAAVVFAPVRTGAFGQAVLALALLVALRRVFRAVWHNERYWFTTLRWGRVVLMVCAFGSILKVLTLFAMH